MNKIIFLIFSYIGKILGYISCIVSPRIDFIFYILKRNYYTQRYKKRFKYFGNKSLLSSNVILIKPQYIQVGNSSSIMSNVVLEAVPFIDKSPELIIGNNVSIGEYSHITSANKVVIGNGVLTGRFVLITDNSHGNNSLNECSIIPIMRNIFSKGPVFIEDNVWIGDKVSILPGVRIGKGSVIGANTVVTKDIPAYSIVVGCNSRIIDHLK